MHDSGLPVCEIITIGSELLFGQITDTNTTYLARELGKIGVNVRFRTAVGDRLEEIIQVIRLALKRCDIVITSGGLGPTLDDMTREAVAQAVGMDLEFREDLMEQIEHIFRRYGYDMPDNNRRQAYVPAGSLVINNPIGTAPAFITNAGGPQIICLPGVPRELKFLLDKEIIPWIIQRFNLNDREIKYKVLKVIGLGESKVDRLIGDLIRPGQDPEVGILTSEEGIRIRITARPREGQRADTFIKPIYEKIRSRLGNKIFGEDDDTLESVIDSMLTKKNFTFAIMETFSCGLAAQKFYQLPSHQLLMSMVTPDKTRIAQYLCKNDIDPDEKSAIELARKTMEQGKADIGLAILGFVQEKKKDYAVNAHVAVIGHDIEKTFSWTMGGSIAAIRIRGSVIGMNTLRLALSDAP